MLYGPSYQLILEGQRTLPSHADILLFSQQDPALLPYYFYPRRIYQIWVMPETDHIYMDLPTPHYPVRPPQSFDADYRIDLFRGGDFIIRKVLKNKKEE